MRRLLLVLCLGVLAVGSAGAEEDRSQDPYGGAWNARELVLENRKHPVSVRMPV